MWLGWKLWMTAASAIRNKGGNGMVKLGIIGAMDEEIETLLMLR